MNAAYGQTAKRWNSSRSDATAGECFAIASMQVRWRKSSRSTDTGHACVEVADVVSGVAVRDSKDPDGPMLVFGPAAWGAFASRVKGGRLDLS